MSLSTIFLSLFLLFSVLSGTAGELLPGSWKLHKSSEENAGILRYDARIPFLSGKALELDGNFDKGGKSVTAYCDLNPNIVMCGNKWFCFSVKNR